MSDRTPAEQSEETGLRLVLHAVDAVHETECYRNRFRCHESSRGSFQVELTACDMPLTLVLLTEP
jgi:hypothetical protein